MVVIISGMSSEKKGMVKTGIVVGVLPLGACRFLCTLSRIGRTSDCFKLSVNKFPSGLSDNQAAEMEDASSASTAPPGKSLPDVGNLAPGWVLTAKARA